MKRAATETDDGYGCLCEPSQAGGDSADYVTLAEAARRIRAESQRREEARQRVRRAQQFIDEYMVFLPERRTVLPPERVREIGWSHGRALLYPTLPLELHRRIYDFVPRWNQAPAEHLLAVLRRLYSRNGDGRWVNVAQRAIHFSFRIDRAWGFTLWQDRFPLSGYAPMACELVFVREDTAADATLHIGIFPTMNMYLATEFAVDVLSAIAYLITTIDFGFAAAAAAQIYLYRVPEALDSPEPNAHWTWIYSTVLDKVFGGHALSAITTVPLATPTLMGAFGVAEWRRNAGLFSFAGAQFPDSAGYYTTRVSWRELLGRCVDRFVFSPS